MTTLGIIMKTPSEILDYDTDCSLWLGAGDVLVSVVATIAGSDAVVDAADVSTDTVKVTLSGGTAGDSGSLNLLITTNLGLVKEACYRLRVKDC